MASELRVNTLKDASGNNSVAMSTVAGGSAKAWADIDMTGTAALDNSSNGSSITDNGTGDVTFTFTSSLSNANYACSGMTTANASFDDEGLVHLNYTGGRAAGSCRFGVTDAHNACDAFDVDPVMVVIHGDLA
jgi:hypothetical protein|tara:strand:+ start:325 stop:723 length:399 start_codon:yes stop_codon:yes gene_type:complete